KTWIEDWNRLRKGKEAVNQISVIELRTDPKYGKFIKHEPARAKVTIARKKDQLVVEIEDVISPTILERLAQQAGLLQPKIDDWRAMVDCVMIDPAYDGKVFTVALSDVPEKKTDLVTGRYELPVSHGKTTVAVKIIDMLGEEVLVTHGLSG
ncbi:MAG: site-specific DNA-methyltransferase, partial [Nitrospirota bacterium]|nr:site-specific DNA-methyltransferase [Nitrospirota bacterium]